MVEAAPQRLAVQRDDPPPWRGGSVSKLLGMVAEGGLDLGRVERVEEGAQGVDGGRATEAGTEDGVEPLAMHADEQADAAVGGRPGEDGQHREEQQGSEAVTLTLAAARIGDLFQGGEQAGERHHGGLRCEGFGPQRPRRADGLAAQTSPSQTTHARDPKTALGIARTLHPLPRYTDEREHCARG